MPRSTKRKRHLAEIRQKAVESSRRKAEARKRQRLGEDGAHYIVDKSEERSAPIQPEEDGVLIHPGEDSVLIHPGDDSVLIHPEVDSVPIRPEEDSVPIRPAEDSVPIHPEVDSVPIRPEEDSVLIRPAEDSVLIRPAEDSVVIHPGLEDCSDDSSSGDSDIVDDDSDDDIPTAAPNNSASITESRMGLCWNDEAEKHIRGPRGTSKSTEKRARRQQRELEKAASQSHSIIHLFQRQRNLGLSMEAHVEITQETKRISPEDRKKAQEDKEKARQEALDDLKRLLNHEDEQTNKKDDDQQDINMAPIWFYDTWHTKELDHPSDPSPASIPD
ncbi:hypothetical protein V8E54_007214 [Elaphomyces granulatus]